MKRFKHMNARSVEEASQVLREYGPKAKVIGGGTDLLGEFKDSILDELPEVIVNIKSIPGLDYVQEDGESLKIGALTRLEDIARHKTIKENYPVLSQAAARWRPRSGETQRLTPPAAARGGRGPTAPASPSPAPTVESGKRRATARRSVAPGFQRRRSARGAGLPIRPSHSCVFQRQQQVVTQPGGVPGAHDDHDIPR